MDALPGGTIGIVSLVLVRCKELHILPNLAEGICIIQSLFPHLFQSSSIYDKWLMCISYLSSSVNFRLGNRDYSLVVLAWIHNFISFGSKLTIAFVMYYTSVIISF